MENNNISINALISFDEYNAYVEAHPQEVIDIMAEAVELGHKRLKAFLASGGDTMMLHMIAFTNEANKLPQLQRGNQPAIKIPETGDMLTVFIGIACNELLMPIILENSKPRVLN